MPTYCVNERERADGHHEVHRTSTCKRLPDEKDRVDLEDHPGCLSAVREAKKSFKKVDGCPCCCEPCNNEARRYYDMSR